MNLGLFDFPMSASCCSDTLNDTFFFKALLLCIEIYGMAALGMSYYLAWLGRDIVLEELSKTIVKTIIYPFIAFTINRTIENYAEHNITQFHKPLSETPIEESEEADG